MLIVLPPSDTKRPAPPEGRPVELGALSFPELTAVRTRILDAMIATSGGADALRRLQVRSGLAAEVARNTLVRELPAMPVLDLYSGRLHAGLDAASLAPEAAEQAAPSLVVTSPLWGLLRPADRVPPYRLFICSRLVGMDRIKPTWRAVLGDVIASAAGPSGMVLDLRSPNYQAMGMPTRLGDRTINLHVGLGTGAGFVGDMIAKRVRGQAALRLLEAGEEPGDPGAVSRILADRWPMRIQEPDRPGKPWTLDLTADA